MITHQEEMQCEVLWIKKTCKMVYDLCVALILRLLWHLCCNLARSVGSRAHWFWDTARKRNAFLCFPLFWEFSNCYNFGTTGPIQVGFSTKCTSPNDDFDQIENWKCHMFNFRLIPLDNCITFFSPLEVWCQKSSQLMARLQWSQCETKLETVLPYHD